MPEPTGRLDPLSTPDPVGSVLAEHERPPTARRLLALRTGGTSTGTPRTVVRSTTSWVDSFPVFSALTGTGPQSRVWVPGPVTATMNLFALTHSAWSEAVQVGSLHADPQGPATHAHLTPAQLARLVALGTPLTGVVVVVAGDRLEPELHARAVSAGAVVHHYYGAAELSFVAWGPHAEALRPFPGVEVRVDAAGALWARSLYVSASATPDADGWCSVGDVGRIEPDGTLRVLGRPGAVTTAGATVTVAEVEAVLRPAAPDGVVVLGVPHPDLGAVVTAVHTASADLAEMKALALEELSPAGRPRRWVEVEEWPLTTAGKVDRTVLLDVVLDELD